MDGGGREDRRSTGQAGGGRNEDDGGGYRAARPDGQVGLDLACLDRIYLNGYVPNLQVPGQIGRFLTGHLGYSIPSPALFTVSP